MTDWRSKIATANRAEFVEQYPHPFLLLQNWSDDDPEEIVTGVSMVAGDIDFTTSGEVIPLIKSDANPYAGRVIVGRARNCDVVLRGSSVSKFHADFRVLNSRLAELTDRGSRNGTAVDNEKLAVGRAHQVKSGSRIRFGTVDAMFLGPGELYDTLA